MIFFDEIHQGASSTDNEAQQKIISHYVGNKTNKLTFPFIMVTATFLKPIIKYKYSKNGHILQPIISKSDRFNFVNYFSLRIIFLINFS